MLRIDLDNASDVAVEHILHIVVARLHDFVAEAESDRLRLVCRRRIQCRLQTAVEQIHTACLAPHGREHLQIHEISACANELCTNGNNLRGSILARYCCDE